MALINQFEIVDQNPFLFDVGGARSSRPRRHATNICMVAAGGHIKQDLVARIEYRGHHRNVGQVGAAIIGCVEHIDIARLHGAVIEFDDGFHRTVHGAKMHRHVRGIGDQLAFGVKHGAGEIQPLLDVHGIGGVLQRYAHLLGDRHEQVVEHFKQNRISIGAGSDHCLALLALCAGQYDVVEFVDRGLPAGLDDDCLVVFDNQRWPLHAVARTQRFAWKDCRIDVATAAENRCELVSGYRVFLKGCSLLRYPGATTDGFHLQGFDDQWLFEDKTKLFAVCVGEEVTHGLFIVARHGNGCVGAVIAQVNTGKN